MNVFSNAPTKLFKLAPVSTQENKCCNEKIYIFGYLLFSLEQLCVATNDVNFTVSSPLSNFCFTL